MPYFVEVPSRDFAGQVLAGVVDARERGGYLDQCLSRLIGSQFYPSSDSMFLPSCRFPSGCDRGAVPNAIVSNFFIQLDYEMSAESGFLAVSLLDAVYGVVTGNFFFLRIDLDEGDTFIAVGLDHDIVVTILFEAELHNAGTGESGQFGMDAIVIQVN